MDVDISVVKRNHNMIDIYKSTDIDALQRGDFLYLRVSFDDIEVKEIEGSIFQFLNEIAAVENSFFTSIGTLEIAVYYDFDEHVNFSYSFSNIFLSTLSRKKLNLELICYPCSGE